MTSNGPMSSLPRLAFVLMCVGVAVTTSAILVDGESPLWLPVLSALAGGVTTAIGALVWSRCRAEDARITQLSQLVERVHAGEYHLFAPVAGDDRVARLAGAINGLADDLRAHHLVAASDRVLGEAMVRESPNGLVIVDERGIVRRCNPAFRTLLRLTEDPVSRPLARAVPIRLFSELLEEVAQSRAEAERPATVGGRDLMLRWLPLADGAGCLGVVFDVTSVRSAERVRRDFVANVSHEIRTPVTALTGYAEVLLEERGDLPPAMVPMVEAIDRNARRLHLLVEDVLQLSRIEARPEDFPLTRESLLPLVEEVVERHGVKARQGRITITVNVPETMEALVNPDAFGHALGNLIDNAVKYSPPGGHVRVTGVRDGTYVRLDVEDDGVGISPVHHPRIFERFYRGDPARSKEIPGTGLGLALVKHLCLAMRAEVGFESEPGRGSRFWLKLPG